MVVPERFPEVDVLVTTVACRFLPAAAGESLAVFVDVTDLCPLDEPERAAERARQEGD